MIDTNVCYKICYNKDGEAVEAEDSSGKIIEQNPAADPFDVYGIVKITSDPILISVDREGIRHCWRYIGRWVCLSC